MKLGRRLKSHKGRATHPHGRGFAGRQRLKTLTMFFGPTAQTRRLRQPRPAAATAADQNIQFSLSLAGGGAENRRKAEEELSLRLPTCDALMSCGGVLLSNYVKC